MANIDITVNRIDTAMFDNTIAALKDAVERYRDAKEKFFVASEVLFRSWEGEGCDAFEKQYRLLKTRITDEEDNLRTLKTDFENMRQSYVDWDTETASGIKGEG